VWYNLRMDIGLRGDGRLEALFYADETRLRGPASGIGEMIDRITMPEPVSEFPRITFGPCRNFAVSGHGYIDTVKAVYLDSDRPF